MIIDVPEPIQRAVNTNAPFPHDKLATLLLRFINKLKQTGRSSHTLAAYRNDLSLFSEFLIQGSYDPQNHSFDIRSHWLQFLSENGRKSQASVRRALMSVRTFMHFLVSEKIIQSSPLLEVKSPTQPRHDLLTILPGPFRQLCLTLETQASQGNEKSIRDWALVLLLGFCGLKASEAAVLSWGNIFFEVDVNHASSGGSLRVPGLNERVLHFGPDLSKALALLKEVRKNLNLDVTENARLFFGYLNVSRKTRTDSMHRHGIKFVVYEVCEEILGVPYNSESLRNHAIMKWLDQGLSVQKVADLAGYSSLNSLDRFSLLSRGIRKSRRQTKTDI